MHFALLLFSLATSVADLERARDRQDRAALEKLATEARAAASRQPNSAAAQHRLAVAQSFAAEVAMELRDKAQAKTAAEAGIAAAEKAVALDGGNPEHHRMLGTLCGQVIPANVWAGLKYGRCALDSINKAIELDPKAALNYVSRGVGNYYLPPAFGGGVDKAIEDFRKALQLNPRLAEAHLWLGIALRKANRNAEARQALQKSLELNPDRLWTKQQLEKTPAR
ncbi:MAG TPA: tetratricopeptide repeat protein [Bryobacteraceae bacterium]|nr:tetratricopeptide repeat protein [Bryobacteraceae bacterium]